MPGLCWAGPITYVITNHPNRQQGATVAGTITTDGTIGQITSANVLSWEFVLISSLGVAYHFASTDPNYFAGITPGFTIATEQTLTYHLPGGVGGAIFRLGGSNNGNTTGYYIDHIGGIRYLGFDPQGAPLWGSRSQALEFEIASVQPAAIPEPGTLTLALAGLGGLTWVRLARRWRGTAFGPSANPPTHS